MTLNLFQIHMDVMEVNIPLTASITPMARVILIILIAQITLMGVVGQSMAKINAVICSYCS